MSFGLAGVAGVNPVFFLFEVLLILAWRNAGYIGLDRWVLPALGTPWSAGPVFQARADRSSNDATGRNQNAEQSRAQRLVERADRVLRERIGDQGDGSQDGGRLPLRPDDATRLAVTPGELDDEDDGAKTASGQVIE
jgi:hypothetical protein